MVKKTVTEQFQKKADRPVEGAQQPQNVSSPQSGPSSKNTCCMFALIALILLALFFVGAVISGIVLWKIYGPSFIENFTKSMTSSVTKQATDEILPSITPLTRESTPASTTIGSRPMSTPSATGQPTVVEQQSSGMEGEIVPESNIRNVTRADLLGLTPWELKVARNEIYARHGRTFVHQDLACYFAKTSWYLKDPSYTDSRLSQLELSNAAYILNYEKEIRSPVWNVDTGCR